MGSLVNDTFPNLKLVALFVVNKYVKQVVLIIIADLPPFRKRMWIGILFILQKMWEGTFFAQEGRG